MNPIELLKNCPDPMSITSSVVAELKIHKIMQTSLLRTTHTKIQDRISGFVFKLK